MKRLLSLFTLIVFCFSSLNSYAVNLTSDAINRTSISNLLSVSQPFAPLVIKGLKLYADDPFKFDFMVDEGGLKHGDAQLKEEAQKLINYFLVSLTIPDNDLWVNLSPYEKDRIVTSELGSTGMGQDMLNQDYILKQLASSLTFPESETGKAYWQSMSGVGANNHSPVNNFNRVWIVPDKAVVYTDTDKAYVGEATLKVMVEEDYLAMQKNNGRFDTSRSLSVPPRAERIETNGTLSDRSATAFKTHILPALTKEVNEGANFASLRQMYKSLILAAWFKKHLKENVINKLYADKKKIDGVNTADPQIKEKIYNQYLASCKKGIYNIVERERTINKITKRAYFSGGLQLAVSPEDVPLSKASAGTTSADAVISGKMENAGNDDIGSEDGAVRPLEIAGYRYGLAYYADGKHQIRTSRQSLTKHLEAFRARLPEGKITVKRVQHFIDGHETLHILKRELMKYDSEVASIDKTTEEALANVVGAAFADNHAIVPPQLLYAVKILERALNKKFAERHKPAITDFLEFIQNLNPYDSKDPKSLEVLLQDIDIDVVVEDATLAELKALQEKVKGGESEAVAAGSDSVSAASAPQAAPLASKIAAQRCTQGREDYQNSLLFGDNSAAKIESAIENFTVAIKGGILAAYFERAKCLYLQARVDEAKSDLIKYVLLMLDKGGSFLERCRARGYDVTSNTALAEAFLKQFEEEIFESSPQAVRAYNFRGEVYLGYGQYGKAIVEFRKALRIDPGDAQAIANMAQASSLAHAVANTDAPKVITSDPQAAAVCIGRGNAYLAHKEYDEANNAYREAIRLDPGNSVAYTGLGNVCMEQNNYPQAIGYYDQAVTHDPNNYDALHNRGNAHLRQGQQGDYTAAIADLDKAIEGYKKSLAFGTNGIAGNASLAIAYIHRGEAYSRLSNEGKAIADFQEALKIEPDNSRAQLGMELALFVGGSPLVVPEPVAAPAPKPRPGKDIAELKARLGLAKGPAAAPVPAQIPAGLDIQKLTEELLEIKGDDDKANYARASMADKIRLDMNSNKSRTLPPDQLLRLLTAQSRIIGGPGSPTLARMSIGGVIDQALSNDPNRMHSAFKVLAGIVGVDRTANWSRGTFLLTIRHFFTNDQSLTLNRDQVQILFNILNNTGIHGYCNISSLIAEIIAQATHNDRSLVLLPDQAQSLFKVFISITGIDYEANWLRAYVAEAIRWDMCNDKSLIMLPDQVQSFLKAFTDVTGAADTANWIKAYIVNAIWQAMVNDPSLVLSSGEIQILSESLTGVIDTDFGAQKLREAIERAIQRSRKNEKTEVRGGDAIQAPASKEPDQPAPAGENAAAPVVGVGDISIDTAAATSEGRTLLEKGDYRGAIASYKKAIENGDNNAETYADLGAALLHLGEFDKAVICFKRVLKIDPTCVVAYTNMGFALLAKNDYPGVISNYEIAVALGDNRVETYVNMGVAYLHLGRYGEAVKSLESALTICSDAQIRFKVQDYLNRARAAAAPVDTPAPADANPMDKFIDRDFRQAHSDGSIITMLQDALGSMDEDLRAMALANPELGIALGRDILGKVAAGMPASAEGDFFQRGISVSADPVMITRSEVEGAGLRWRDFCAKLVGGNVIGKVRNKSREILLPANSDLSATGEIAEALGADFTAILPVLQKAMAQAQGVSHVKPVTIAGIIHGLFVVHADGRRAIYVNHDELQNHLGDIARYMGVKSVTLEQARRFIDGHETFHAFVHWLSEHYKGFKGISSAQEEKLADMLGKVFVYGYSKAVELELITFFEDLDYELKTNFSTLLKASPASIEGFLLNLGIDVDIIVKNPGELKEISEQPGARVMKKMQTGGKGGVGGVNFNSSKLNLQEKGKGIKLNSSFAAAIDPANFTGFTFKITGISRLGKAQ